MTLNGNDVFVGSGFRFIRIEFELCVCVSDCVHTSNWCSDDKWKEVGGPNTRDWDLDPIAHPLPRITGVLVFGFRIDFGFRAALEPLPTPIGCKTRE